MKVNKKYKFDQFFKKTRGKKQRKIDFIILHNLEADSLESGLKMFRDYQVSAHYIIDPKGEVFLIVEDNDISYHAGYSYWRGVRGLNKYSIGIEFLSPDVNDKKFSKKQLESGVKLCQKLIKKYKIDQRNIMAHSDIGYYPKGYTDINGINLEGLLDRKQDPSHQFNWRYLYNRGVGIYPDLPFRGKDRILFRYGDKYKDISIIKKKLSKFGYKVKSKSDVFDLEMKLLVRVFNRRFNQNKYKANPDIWWKSSSYALSQIISD